MDSFSDYKRALIKKLKSVLIPYILWILIYFLYDGFSNLIGETRSPFFDKTLREYSNFFFGFPKKNLYRPAIGQFWYLRDLMIMYILSPVILKATKKFPALYISISCLYYFSSLPLSYEWGNAFFYFGLGCFFSQRNFSVSSIKLKLKDLTFAYVLVLFIQCITFFFDKFNFSFIVNLNIAIGSLLLLKIAENLSKNEKIFPVLKNLSDYSFWIFAVHYPFVLAIIFPRIQKFFPALEGNPVLLYFVKIVTVFIISFGSGILCKKLTPPLFNLLCGGRSKREKKSPPTEDAASSE